jgi:hypothetical protein
VTTALLAAALLVGSVLLVDVPVASARPLATAPPTAQAALQTLTVKGRAPLTGYDRKAYGTPWADVDHNGCDTRNDILARDLTHTVIASDCTVTTGILSDPYTLKQIQHIAGRSAIDIDHVVSLGNAWQTGSFQWPSTKRIAFANDPLNLLAVDASANRQKGDGDAATWLPPNKAYRCPMVARQIAVKAKYGLWVTPAERDAMSRVLSTCPGQKLPTG